jgi:hypothetical protein
MPSKRANRMLIELIALEGGSIEPQKIPNGIRFGVSRAQLEFLTACLDIARFYNDDSLREETLHLRRCFKPSRSRDHRDPKIAAQNRRGVSKLALDVTAQMRAKDAHRPIVLGLEVPDWWWV